MRLIDVDKLEPHWIIRSDGTRVYAVHFEDIEKAQPIDAVPVVRCKDCKHSYFDTTPYGELRRYGEDMYNCWRDHMCVKDDFFCACGERICNETD